MYSINAVERDSHRRVKLSKWLPEWATDFFSHSKRSILRKNSWSEQRIWESSA